MATCQGPMNYACNGYNMGMGICLICMPEAQGPQAWGIRAFISGKSWMHILQVLCNAIVTTLLGWMPQVIVTLVCGVISINC